MKYVGEKRATRRARGFSVVVGRMGAAMTLVLRRLTLLCLRKLVDVADNRLHAAENKLRKDLSNGQTCREVVNAEQPRPRSTGRYANTPRICVRSESANLAPRSRLGNPACPVREKVSPSAVKMAANLKVSGLSLADAASAMRNLGFTAKEVSAVCAW
jgi:hypothetical protein